nr:MAG TPA_asm: hypothetical protein [Caudoviricetes sp.]
MSEHLKLVRESDIYQPLQRIVLITREHDLQKYK